MKDKRRPLIRIFETMKKGVFAVEVDTLRITKDNAYVLMGEIIGIYKKDQRKSVIRGKQ